MEFGRLAVLRCRSVASSAAADADGMGGSQPTLPAVAPPPAGPAVAGAVTRERFAMKKSYSMEVSRASFRNMRCVWIS